MKLLQNPVYGEDYKEGYVFFSYSNNSFISTGLALFQMGDSVSGQMLSHCGIISGDGLCVEATTPDVCESNFIQKYVNESHTMVFLKKPVGWSMEMSLHMIEEAKKHIGEGYAYSGVVGSALYVIFTGGWKICPWLRRIKNPFNPKNKMFCSELVAAAMQHVIGKKGILVYDPSNVYPSTLYEDNTIWQPWDLNIVDKKIQQGKVVI